MLWTAAIMLCLPDVDRSFETCNVLFNSKFKYSTEVQCYEALARQMNFMMENNQLYGHEFVEAKCTVWGASKDSEV